MFVRCLKYVLGAMNENQWEREARELARKHSSRITQKKVEEMEVLGLACPLPSDVRRALVEIDSMLRSAPTPIQQRYKNIAEADLRSNSAVAQENLQRGSLKWLDVPDIVWSAASQVRALDDFLFEHRDRGKPSDASTDFLCKTTGAHVIPRAAAKRPKPNEVRTLTYRRRGLFRHRILPVDVGGYTIKPYWFKDLSLSFRNENSTILAALFEGLALERCEDFDNFVASAAPCLNEDLALAAQARRAYADNVMAAVWPELTMPEDRRKKLVDYLEKQSKLHSPGVGPRFIAAGSWHEVDGKNVRNRMHILSGTGVSRFHHDKSLPMESRRLGKEELTPSYEVPVLIAEDVLIAFAICRDFCEAQVSRVYQDLDVDLVIVPSYGDKKTIYAHYHAAQSISTESAAAVFVVQQVVSDEVATSGWGYVLPTSACSGVSEVSDFIVDSYDRLDVLSFKKV